MAAPNVANCRTLKKGMRGDDVTALKRAISHVLPSVYLWQGENFTPYFGGELEKAVKRFQQTRGLVVDGIVGSATHEKLERSRVANKPTLWAYDSVAINLANNFCTAFTKKNVRQRAVDAGFFWYENRGQIYYRQYRPYPLIKPPTVPRALDCSSFDTLCKYAGGMPDPNGRGFDGQGYTGTMMTTGQRAASVNDLELADSIFYGYSRGYGPAFNRGDPTHVAVYVGKIDGVHSVLSLGSYPMRLLRFDYRSINHYRHYEVGV